MFLLDTNIWLERLLNQAKAHEVKQLLDGFDSAALGISDFSLHSIGIILGRTGKLMLLDQFITDLFVHGQVKVVGVAPAEIRTVITAMQTQRLDFDDAYQYVISKREAFVLVSFDGDFDHTDLPRKTPQQILATLPAAPPAGSQ